MPRYMPYKHSLLKYVRPEGAFRRIPWVRSHLLWYKPGDQVRLDIGLNRGTNPDWYTGARLFFHRAGYRTNSFVFDAPPDISLKGTVKIRHIPPFIIHGPGMHYATLRMTGEPDVEIVVAEFYAKSHGGIIATLIATVITAAVAITLFVLSQN